MELFRMGWRNLRRNRRRTALNVVALAIGIAIMIVTVAWVRGYFTSLFEGIIELDTGHAQVLHEEYRDERRRLPLDLTVPDYEALRDELLEDDAVEAATGRIAFSAQIGNGRRSTRMLARAIEPDGEAELTVLDDHVQRGSYLTAGEDGVLLSEEMAGRMGAEPGDPIFITALDQSGAENFTETVLRGTFALGYPAIDENVFYIDLSSAQRLLGMAGEVTHLVVGLDSGPNVNGLLEPLRTRVSAASDAPLEVYGWRTFVAVIVSAVEADIASFSIIIAVLFLLIVIGILNSMSMAVHERTREIGTLRAIGMKRGQLTRLFLAEGVSVAAVGSVVGAVLAALVGIYFGIVGFDLSALAGTGLPIPFGERFTADFRVWDFLLGAAIGIVTATAGSLIPTRRASKIAIADALGSHLE